MRIDVEAYGPARRDFYDLRSELIEDGKRFDSAVLSKLPYHQLHLTCIGNAGVAACSPELVQQEKAHRRERYTAMDEGEFKACERYLRTEEMYDDVILMVDSESASYWADLNNRQKTWAKLNCIYNHIDDPHPRMAEAIQLLRECSTTTLPNDVCLHYSGRLRSLMSVYPGSISDDFFRAQIEDIRDNIRDFLPDEERKTCDKEQIADFQCTSDCFRIVV